jgi:hypothetical protein
MFSHLFMFKKAVFIFILSSIISPVISQEFHKSGDMKIYGMSTDKEYGYEPDSEYSIKVGEIKNQRAYLNSLLGPNGEPIEYVRVGNCCEFDCKTALFGKGLLDRYQITYKGLKKPIILYLNGYQYEKPLCPIGFTMKDHSKDEKPIIFPVDSIKKVTLCSDSSIYSIDYYLLNEKIGPPTEPDQFPFFEGGIEQLITYFATKTLTDELAKNMIFKVIIAFKVDCNGNAGDFTILTKGSGTLEVLANQVLEAVNYMPQKWKPAVVNNKSVDAYQFLTFSIKNGDLTNVTYKIKG